MSYQIDRFEFGDPLIPLACRELGPILGKEASVEQDTKEATDIVFPNKRVAFRTRRAQFFARYPNEFTIRYSRPSGVPTEYDKIMNGHGDWMFYAFANESGDGFLGWHIIDLHAFREKIQAVDGDVRKIGTIHGSPFEAQFLAVDLTRATKEPLLVIASTHAVLSCRYGRIA